MDYKKSVTDKFLSQTKHVAKMSKRIFASHAPDQVVSKAKQLNTKLKGLRSMAPSSPSTYPDLSHGTPGAPHAGVVFDSIKVGAILDEFSFLAWSSEFNLIPLNPEDWLERIESGIDLLLVESAWAGNGGSWQYQLTGSRAPSDSLRTLISECRKRGIPTVFWNKEDPPHYEDFLDSARLFDVLFTTDKNMVPEYTRQLGHDRVFVLPFAAQPTIHNPARNNVAYADRDIAFGGTYFRNKFSERRSQIDLLLGAADEVARKNGFSFVIFSRHAGGDEKYQFPDNLAKRVEGSLPYSNMLAAYRSFKVFLNVNSVVNSPSMCARRIFEIVASGTVVVSTRSLAVPQFFPQDEVPVIDDSDQAKNILRALVNSPELRERMTHRAQRRIWSEHTYHHRALEILAQTGIAHSSPKTPKVSIICSTNRDPGLRHLLSQVSHQRYPELELIVLGHGINLENDLTQRAADLGIALKSLKAPQDWKLGACLNYLVEEASGEIVAKFDDDDFYSPNYLWDQVAALNYSGADLVGKSSIFFYLAGPDLIVRRWPEKEHKWTNFVAGATFVGPRSTFLSSPFEERNAGEDSAFLRQLEKSGMSVYSADRFNYMAVRRESTDHTWEISDTEILSYSAVETVGLNLNHIQV